MYVAHYAPHLPLQAPADRVEKCRDRYKVGYDVLRKQRFDRLKELKFISDEMDYPVYQKEFGRETSLLGNAYPKATGTVDYRYGNLCRHDRNCG